jgi:hypothetical protein
VAISFHYTPSKDLGSQVRDYFFQNVLSWQMAVQLVVIAGAILFSFRATRGINDWITRLEERPTLPPEVRAELPRLMTFKKVIRSFLSFLIVWIAYGIAGHFHWHRDGLYAAGIILIALTLVQDPRRRHLAVGRSVYFQSHRSLVRALKPCYFQT